MHKLKLYLDTTILNFAFADDAPKERDVTLTFFKHVNRFEVSISDIVIKEINRSSAQKRDHLAAFLSRFDFGILEFDKSAQELADRYIKEGIIPIKYQDDAFHIAIATVNNMDAILSWNFQHIVKVKTKREVVGINLIMGYRPIDIYTPLEVVDYV